MGRMGKRGPEQDGDSLQVRVRAEAEARCVAVPAGHLLSRLVAWWSKRQLAGTAPGAELPAKGMKAQRGAQTRRGCCLAAGSW